MVASLHGPCAPTPPWQLHLQPGPRTIRACTHPHARPSLQEHKMLAAPNGQERVINTKGADERRCAMWGAG